MRQYAPYNPKLVIGMLNFYGKWSPSQDNLAFHITSCEDNLNTYSKALLQALRQAMVFGWTTEEEYREIGRINEILNKSNLGFSEKLFEENTKDEVDRPQDHSSIGTLSEKYETGGRGPGTVSTGKGDRGGVSYGLYQMSSKLKVVDDFIANEGKQWQVLFKNSDPGSKEFSEIWKKISNDSTDAFSRAQHEYIYRTHYKVMADRLNKLGINVKNRSDALKDVVWSTAVQHGPHNSIFQTALAGQDLQQIDDKKIIKLVYNERGRKNKDGNLVHFKSNSEGVQKGVSKRFVNEMNEALEKLENEKK